MKKLFIMLLAFLICSGLFSEEAGPVPEFCGAYIDETRGSLIVPEVSTEDYPKGLDIFPDGSFHLYDNMFFYMNLKENVALRVSAYLDACEEEVPLTGGTDIVRWLTLMTVSAAGLAASVISRKKRYSGERV